MVRVVLFAVVVTLAGASHAAATTFTVTSADNADDGTCAVSPGHCSLSEAISAANAAPGGDEIDFEGATTVEPVAALPAVVDPVTINGTTAPNCDGAPEGVILEGNGAALTGLTLTTGSNGTLVCAVNVRGFGNDGIRIDSASNIIQRSRIGTNATGTAADPNGTGIRIEGGDTNLIGGSLPGDGNVIAGNTGDGISMSGDADVNAVEGNLIGLGADGVTPIKNQTGVFLSTLADSRVGGTDPLARNVISGHATGSGVIAGAGDIIGNYLGTDVTGMIAVPNQHGIIADGPAQIGGALAAERNVIGSGEIGVRISAGATLEGNWIGTKADGTAMGTFIGVIVEGDGARVGGPGTAGNVVAADTTGIDIDTAVDGAVIEGNLIGLLPDGVTPAAPTGDLGIRTFGSASDVDVVGNTIAAIAGNAVESAGSDIRFRGNVIGLDTTGAAAPNADGGIEVDGDDHTIGGPGAADRNVLSGNATHGIDAENVSGLVVEGNWIGVGTDGSAVRGNGSDGIVIGDTTGARVAGNRIAHNGGDGIAVDDDTTGAELVANSLFSNTGLGIDVASDGVTPNDPGDVDLGRQNFPVLSTAETDGSATVVGGTIDTTAGRSIRIEVFSSATCDASGSGEGETVLGTATVTAGSGATPFSAPVGATDPGRQVTATATDLVTGETSELSGCLAVTQKPTPATTTTTTTTTTPAGGGGPAPAPPPPVVLPVPPLAPKFPAKIRVLRNGVDDGVLDMLIEVTSRAVIPGAVFSIDYESSGRHTRFTVPITGTQVKVRKRLPSSQPKDTGITTVTYAGNGVVGPDDVRLRAADGKSLLTRTVARLSGGRLTVEGTLVDTARGVVRIRLGYDRPDGTTAFLSWNAPIDDGAWTLAETLPAGVAAGQLSIQFTGYERRNLRGEQTAKAVP